MNKIVVFGSGGHAKVVCDVIESCEHTAVYGLIDSFRTPGEVVHGYEVLGDESVIINHQQQIHGGVVAIGDNWDRSRIAESIRSLLPHFHFVTLIHPSAVIGKEVKFGQGSVIMAGTVINSGVIMGDHCLINTRSSIDHDCVIGNYSTVAPGATLGGNVTVGDYSVISLGSNVIQSINIGEHTVIGAGSTVVKDIDSYVVAYGTPARPIRARLKGEKYL